MTEQKQPIFEQLLQLYTKPSRPNAFQSAEKLFKTALQQVDPGQQGHLNRTVIKQFLSDLQAYSLTKPKRHRFKRNRVLASGINEVHMVDLANMESIAKANDQVAYWLVIIDCFTKYVWVVPVKDKKAETMHQAFLQVYADEKNRCRSLGSDGGGEFVNRKCAALFKKLSIRHYVTRNEVKASVVERVIRTLKSLVFRYLIHNLTERYIHILQDIVDNYNSTVHSTTRYAPNAITDANSDMVMQKLYPDLWTVLPGDNQTDGSEKGLPFAVGDIVRVSLAKNPFQKGYAPGWSEELFTVSTIVPRNVETVYRLVDEDGEEIRGTWYRWELQKIQAGTNVHRVEKVVGMRQDRRTGKIWYKVKWLNFKASKNSWVTADNLIIGPSPPDPPTPTAAAAAASDTVSGRGKIADQDSDSDASEEL